MSEPRCEPCWGGRPVEEWAECRGHAAAPLLPATSEQAWTACVAPGTELCSCPCHGAEPEGEP